MTPKEEAVFNNGVRWVNNILTELASNYGKKLSTRRCAHLHLVLTNLHELLKQDTNSPGGSG